MDGVNIFGDRMKDMMGLVTQGERQTTTNYMGAHATMQWRFMTKNVFGRIQVKIYLRSQINLLSNITPQLILVWSSP